MPPSELPDPHDGSPSAPPPPVQQSVDDLIYAENLRAHAYAQPSRPPSVASMALGWMADNKLVVIIVGFIVLSGSVAIPLAMRLNSGSDSNPGQLTVAPPEEQATLNFDPGAADGSDGAPISGDENNSGSSDGNADGGQVPSIPANLKASANGTQVAASWNKAPWATQYILQLDRSADFTNPRTIISGATNAAAPGLQPHTRYFLRVQAVGARGSSDWSAIAYATTGNPANLPLPSKVGGLRATPASTRAVTLEWSRTSNASRYSVTRALDAGFTQGRREYAATTATRYTVADLKSGTVYYFKIRASNPAGFGPSSAVITAKTRLTTPGFSSLSVLSSSSVRATWNKPVGSQRFDVRYATRSDFANARLLSTTATSGTISGLAGGTAYYLQVRAKDARYTTGWSTAVRTRTHVAVPRNVTLLARGSTSLKIGWAKSTASTKYELRYAKSSSMSGSAARSTTATSFSLTGLVSNTPYYVQVRAFDGKTWTAWSGPVGFRTAVGPAFNVATFNVLGASHTAPGGKLEGWASGSARMHKAMDVIRTNKLHVVGLQEFQRSQRDTFMSIAGKTWGIYPSTAEYRHGYSVNSIIWDKSRFTLAGAGKRTDLRYFGGSTMYLPWVKLKDKQSNRIIYVTNTHDPADTRSHPNQEWHRLYNARKHREDAMKWTNNGLPVFSVGDFNSAFVLRRADNLFNGDRSKLTYCVITAATPLWNTYDAVRGRSGKCPTKSGGTIDHVYINNKVKVHRWWIITGMRDRQISDHNVTVTRVTLR